MNNCLKCGKPTETNRHIYCGRIEKKIGCSYLVYREKKSNYDKERRSLSFKRGICERCGRPTLTKKHKYCGNRWVSREGCWFIVRKEKKTFTDKRRYELHPEIRDRYRKYAKPKFCAECNKELPYGLHLRKYCINCGDTLSKLRPSLRLRFRILKKFNFTCQYCGRKAPEVILNVDHIIPKSKGGSKGESNLIVACWECNIGKSNIF